MKNYAQNRKGFTLTELLIVIGILAVLACIMIPLLSGIIDRSNRSSDTANSGEMTNAIERFASEYTIYCNDILDGKVDVNNLSATQNRVYEVTKATTTDHIDKLESETGFNGVKINPNTKYPANEDTAKTIIQSYTKASSSTFEPKQSDNHYYYSPDIGVVVTQPTDKATVEQLNTLIQNATDANGNLIDGDTEWIDLTDGSIVGGGVHTPEPEPEQPTPPACQHISTVIKNKVESTCSSTGYSGDIYCASCDNKLAEGVTTGKKSHSYVTTGVTAATCTSAGSTGYSRCSVCGNQNGNATQIAPLGHDMTLISTTPATCAATGSQTYRCSRCEHMETTTVPKTNNHGSTTLINKTEASCVSNGYTGDAACTICGKILTNGSATAALGHTIQLQNVSSTYTGDKVCVRCGTVVERGYSTVSHSGVIPSGGRYVTASGVTYQAGSNFPTTLTQGDTYYFGDYIYKYKRHRYDVNSSGWMDMSANGWGVTVQSRSKTTYGKVLQSIAGRNVVSMYSCYADCTQIVTLTEDMCNIPTTVTDVDYLIDNCSKLVDASNVKIPTSATSAYGMFFQCKKLEKAPVLTRGLRTVSYMFFECVSLTGNIKVEITSLNACYNPFEKTSLPIRLVGTGSNTSVLSKLATKSNVTY